MPSPPPPGDQRAEVAAALQVAGGHSEAEGCSGEPGGRGASPVDLELGAVQRLELVLHGGDVRPEAAGHAAFVADGERGLAELLGALHQFASWLAARYKVRLET